MAAFERPSTGFRRRVVGTGQRELLFIAIIVVIGISAAAVLLNARVKLQGLANLFQLYRTNCEAMARNVNQLVDGSGNDQMSTAMASFIVSRIAENMSRSSTLSEGINKNLDELSDPVTRFLAPISPIDVAVLRNNEDTRKLREFAAELLSARPDNLKAVIAGIDKEFAIAIRYGDYLDELRHRVGRASELSHQGTQPLLLLLLGIGASVVLGIWAVWLRALNPAITALQASNTALEKASNSLQAQNLAYLRREAESLAAQRIAKFGYWVVKDGGELQCSEGLGHLFETGEQALPRTTEELARIGTPAMQHIDGQLEADILSGYRELSRRDGAREFSRVLRGSNGQDIIVRERVESSVDNATAARYMIGIMLDVTELAQAQARAARADKLESIGVLTGVIAHDFNNVLALLKGSIDLMEMRPETIEVRIPAMRQAVANATTLIARLGSIGRGETEDQSLIDLRQVLPETINLFKANVLNTVRVTLDMDEPGSRLIRIDRGKFESAILNLFVNASEASAGRPDPTIRLSCRVEDDPVVEGRDGRRLKGQFVRLELSDNGAGMSPEVLRRAVDPFFSTKPHHSSLQRGLGLWSVYQTMQRAKGGLSIVSKEGQGTTIVMHFPRMDAGASIARADGERPRAPSRAKETRVLIVDDAEQLLEVLRHGLSARGYTTRTASDISSALQALHDDDTIEVIVTDINLRHGETGLQLATHIRDTYPGKKIIFISGYPTTMQAGGLHADVSVVTKPIDIGVLDGEIQRVVGG